MDSLPDEPTVRVDSINDHSNKEQAAKGPLRQGMILNDRYLIDRELGRGGVGVVYIARDQQLLSRSVVIKVLLDDSTQNDWFRVKFLQEIEALTRIDHPGVVGILDAGTTPDSKSYLVMQYVAGIDLRSVIKPAGMDLKRVALIMRQVGHALSAAHDKGVYHRDLKPGNIMLQDLGGGEEQVKIIDFGIARIKDSLVATNKETTAVAGTITYMAPEQLMGKPSAYSDVYALGVIAYEMVTGRHPFNPASPYQLLELQRAGVKVRPTALRPDLPEAAQDVILKALSFDPNDRHARAREFGKELAESLTVSKEKTPEHSLRQINGTALSQYPHLIPSKTISISPGHLLPGLPSDFTPDETIDKHPNNLPVQPTPLVGREAEIAAAKNLFKQQNVRLLTLTGPGGTGKTRLGLQVAADLIESFEDGVYFVSLAPISDPALVASEIAQVLSVQESGGMPLIEILKEHLRNKQMLLVLDNFEQVIAAAPLVAELLATSSRLKILMTSRAVLHLRGEYEFSVPPLALPDSKHLPPAEILAEYPAIALFIQRARAVKRDFGVTQANARAVAEICIHLDGLPLAIELAAARTKLLTPQAVLPRLKNQLKWLTGGARDLPARQQTMRSTIAWSYDLLNPEEKALFRRMSVFVGGCTLDAVEAICNETGDLNLDLLDGISSLVDKSLVLQEEQADEESRFVMLGVVQEYGQECLVGSGEAEALHQRHVAYFLTLAHRVEPELRGPEQAMWLERLDREHDNLRAALYWLKESGDVEMGLQLSGLLWRFWQMRNYLSEGCGWLEELFALGKRGGVSTSTRAKALMAQGNLLRLQGEPTTAGSLYEESLALYRELGDKQGIAYSLSNWGIALLDNGEYKRAAAALGEGLELLRELGDKWGVANSLNVLADVATEEGDYGRAQALYEESLVLQQELKDQLCIAVSLNNLGRLARRLGDYKRAKALLAQSLIQFRVLGGLGFIANCMEEIAIVVCAEGQLDGAARLFGVASTLRDTLQTPMAPDDRADYERSVAIARVELNEPTFTAAWAQGEAMTMDEAFEYAFELAR